MLSLLLSFLLFCPIAWNRSCAYCFIIYSTIVLIEGDVIIRHDHFVLGFQLLLIRFIFGKNIICPQCHPFIEITSFFIPSVCLWFSNIAFNFSQFSEFFIIVLYLFGNCSYFSRINVFIYPVLSEFFCDDLAGVVATQNWDTRLWQMTKSQHSPENILSMR